MPDTPSVEINQYPELFSYSQQYIDWKENWWARAEQLIDWACMFTAETKETL